MQSVIEQNVLLRYPGNGKLIFYYSAIIIVGHPWLLKQQLPVILLRFLPSIISSPAPTSLVTKLRISRVSFVFHCLLLLQ